ncbi:alphan-acetylglucosamine transferase [Fusarium globosum]|uniref:Alphan-acetylglucosamine transferase n=1 Tax=Fusarium globosum TaxID=78864 RepID=A0A8H5YB49_9HYPO|nr:alphan-acetylglucosamine transferase [Fusarium globosum]
MTMPVEAWKCLFIYKSQQALCPTYAHIVGPSPHPHLLEVAVPLQTVATLPWVVMTPDIAVSIDHMVTPEKKDKLGYIVAYQEMLQLFIKNAREGIRRHGASLGDYYRHRYPNLRSWVEYAVLLQDLPSSEREVLFHNAFAQAASFLAFDAMKAHEPISEALQQMNSSQIISKIRKSLEFKLQSAHECPPQDHAIVSHVRQVLVRIGGRGNRAQLELLGTHVESIDLSLTFRYLLGGGQAVREHCHSDELAQQVSCAKVFDGSIVDSSFIQDIFTKLSLELSLTTRYLPDHWLSCLSLQQKRSFEALVEEASAISDQARHLYNIQQLFVIWTYTQGSSARSCKEVIKPQLRKLFKTAAHHLANSKSRTQIVLDTMTLFCIAKLSAEQEPRRQILDPLNRFDAILNTGYQADTPMVLEYCLMSLHRVLVASDFIGRSVHLANFVAQLGLPQLMLGMNDCHIDVYWSQRLWDSHPHLIALDATKLQVGLSIKLPPLQLDDESSDDCITVKVDNPNTETVVLLDEDTGRPPNGKEDLKEIAHMALRLEARRRRKSTEKELKRSNGSRRLREKYKHGQLVRR